MKGINVGSLKEDKKEFIKNKLLIKLQQRFNSERHNIFTKEIRKIAMISSDDKRMPSMDSLKTIPYGMRRDIIWKKEKNKQINIIKKNTKMLNFDNIKK